MKRETDKDENEDEWVFVKPEDTYSHITFWQDCKKNGRMLFKYYKKVKTLYTIYKVVRFIVHVYILYNTLAPFKLF